MAFTKIEPSDLLGRGVVGLPDSPGLTAQQMQEKFDELALDVIVPKFNALSDELSDANDALSDEIDTLKSALSWSAVPTFSNIAKGVRFLKVNSGVVIGGVTMPSAVAGIISVGDTSASGFLTNSAMTNKYAFTITSANVVTCKKIDFYHMQLSGTALAITTV